MSNIWPKDTCDKKNWQVCVSFGLTLGISIYILGFLIGTYFDEKFNSKPVFLIIGTLLAIFSSFYRLIRDLNACYKREDNKKKEK